jgi:hypothetical protein
MDKPQITSRKEKDLIDRFAVLSSDELKNRLSIDDLSKLERKCIHAVLKNGMQVWASGDGRTVVRRTIEKETDFELVHRVLGENIMYGCETYEKAIDLAEWLTRGK